MTIDLTDQEALALQRIVDAALKGGGVTVLNECGLVMAKLREAVQMQKTAYGGKPEIVKQAEG